MELLVNQVLAGLATGAIYACMALAVVMIYQAIDSLKELRTALISAAVTGKIDLREEVA